MEATTLENLSSDVSLNAVVQESEGFDDSASIDKVVATAVRRHNKNYTCDNDSCNVPIEEHDALVWLGCAIVFQIRASKQARDASTQASGANMFGVNRDTPFDKSMKMITYFMDLYVQECKNLGLSAYAGAGSIVSSTIVVEDFSGEYDVKIEETPLPPPVKLSSDTTQIQSDGTLVISWKQTQFSNFYSFVVFYMEGVDPIFREWDVNSSPYTPRINSLATSVVETTNQDVKSVKLTGLDTGSGLIHRVLILCRSKSGKYSYSNELVINQA